jgi:hypothetical protein
MSGSSRPVFRRAERGDGAWAAHWRRASPVIPMAAHDAQEMFVASQNSEESSQAARWGTEEQMHADSAMIRRLGAA